MSDYNRPDRHRLNRVNTRLEKALDEVSRAVGEMRPAKFRWIKGELDQVIDRMEELQRQLVHAIASTDGQLPLDGQPDDADADAQREQDEPDGNDEESARRLVAGRRGRAA